MDLHLVTAGRDFRFYPILIASRKNEYTPFGTGMLNGRTRQRVDQLLQDDLARHRFRDLDHGRKVQVLDRCKHRAGEGDSPLVHPEVRIQLIELSNLSVSSPTKVAVPAIPQVGVCNPLEA